MTVLSRGKRKHLLYRASDIVYFPICGSYTVNWCESANDADFLSITASITTLLEKRRLSPHQSVANTDRVGRGERWQLVGREKPHL